MWGTGFKQFSSVPLLLISSFSVVGKYGYGKEEYRTDAIGSSMEVM